MARLTRFMVKHPHKSGGALAVAWCHPPPDRPVSWWNKRLFVFRI